jgi:hypothetical protein
MEITKNITRDETISIDDDNSKYCLQDKNIDRICHNLLEHVSYCNLYAKDLKIRNLHFSRCQQCIKDFGV